MAGEATLSNVANLIRISYPGGKIPNEALRKRPALDLFPKEPDAEGDPYRVVLQTEHTTGHGVTYALADAAAGPSNYAKFDVSFHEEIALARVTGKALRGARNKGTVGEVALWQREMDSAFERLAESVAKQIFRDGTGALGVITAASTVASTTVTLSRPSDVANFYKGMQVEASSTSTAAIRSGGAGYATIGSLDRQAGTLTTSTGNWSAAGNISDIVAGDTLFQKGTAYNNASFKLMTGIDAWIANSNGSPAALWGTTRTTDPVRLAGQRVDLAGNTPREALIELVSRVVEQEGSPDTCFMHPRDFGLLAKTMQESIRYQEIKGTSGIGLNAAVVNLDGHEVRIVTDAHCVRGQVPMLQLDSWKLASYGPCPQIGDFDKAEFLRQGSADGYEERVVAYGGTTCHAPAWNAVGINFGS